MPAPEDTQMLRSFDGGVVMRQRVSRPEKYRDLEAVPPDRIRITRGGGLSYAAASFGNSGLVQEARAFNRILDFDSTAGIIECEAGITLQKLYEFLSPAGWYLPVQPGYAQITVGGCIAADVHGKNQYVEGTFSRSLKSVRLFHPAHGIVEADRIQNRELFELTAGGFGLTGQILSAKIQLQRVTGGTVRIFSERIGTIEDTVRLLEQHAASAPLLYTWHNFTGTGRSFGSGFLYGGEFVSGSRVPSRRSRVGRIDAESRGRLRFQLLNRTTTPLFNTVYETAQKLAPSSQLISLSEFLFPVTTKTVFFELFGRAGFHEYQMLLPKEAFVPSMREIAESVQRDRTPVCLASCKLFRGQQSLLRFDGNGVCVALDFPRDQKSAQFAAFLDDVARRHGAIPNIAKDSRLPREMVKASYRDYDSFRDRLHAHDPRRIYRSELSERLGL